MWKNIFYFFLLAPYGRLTDSAQRLQLFHPEPCGGITGHTPRRRKLRIPRLRVNREGSLAPLLLLSPRGPLCWARAGAPWATGGESRYQFRVSSSSIQSRAEASEGIRQSPRGDRVTEPTLGPSGRQERLNCWAKNRR